jgi:hypothetical protein
VLIAALLSLTFMPIPTLAVAEGVEGAWSSVLAFAHQKSMQFGTQIVYPYGPLGFLILPHFTPESAGARLFADAALAVAVSVAVCLLAWRLNKFWRIVILALLSVLAADIAYAPHDLLLNLALLSWGLLCVVESRARLRLYAVVLVVLAVFCALAKVSSLLTATVTICAVAIDFWGRGKRILCFGTVCGFVLGIPVLWLSFGQALANLAAFVSRGLAMAAGYGQTMALEPANEVLVGGFLLVIVAATLIVLRCTLGLDRNDATLRWRRLVLLVWLFSLLFLTWKHGLLRGDVHHNCLFLGFVAVMIPLLQVIPCEGPKLQNWATGLAWTGCILSVLTLEALLYPGHIHLESPFRRAVYNVKALLDRAHYRRQMDAGLAETRTFTDLPKLSKTVATNSVDVFGNYQSYAVLNGLNYRPRPVFQSFAAFSAPLMRQNEEFYLSKAAPDYVLFRLDAIDRRFPPLEDALLFRYLLANYEFIGAENWCLLLKARSAESPHLLLVDQGTVRRGEFIDLRRFGDANLWLQLEVKETLLGGLRRFLYQPAALRLVVRGGAADSQPAEFRAPAPMLAAGFVASPLLTNNEAVINLYSRKSVVRPESYAVDFAPTKPAFWEPKIHYRLFRIQSDFRHLATRPAQAPIASGS